MISATQKFYDSNKDPKAQIITTLEGFVDNVTAIVLFFYDGPNKPASFDFFDDAKSLISTVKTQSFASFVNGIPSELELNSRGAFNSLSTSKLTPAFLAAVQNETLVRHSQACHIPPNDQPLTCTAYSIGPHKCSSTVGRLQVMTLSLSLQAGASTLLTVLTHTRILLFR